MISNTLAMVFKDSYNYSKKHKTLYVTVEHIFGFLLQQEEIKEVFGKMEVDSEELDYKIFDYIENHMIVESLETGEEPVESVLVQEVIDKAIKKMIAAGRHELFPTDVLYQLILLKDSQCTILMEDKGVTEQKLMDVISEYQRERGETQPYPGYEGSGSITRKPKKAASGKSPLVNLSVAYKELEKEPLIGRDNELQRMVQILSRKKKSNPILVGEAGVGKTSIINGLIERIESGEVPDNLKDAQVFGLNLGSLTAGTKYRGDFEAKVDELMKELKGYDNPILFIDEIHNMIGAGGTSNSTLDMSEMLKPALASGELKCIGTTTYKEYKNSFQKNDAMNRRFSKIDIKEPSVEDSVKILTGIKGIYERHHGVKYTDEVIERIVVLAQKYLHDKFLPDSAIDLMDEVGSKKHVIANKKSVVTLKDLDNTISELANVPSKNLDSGNKKMLKNLNPNLKKVIFGQDDVIDLVTDTVLVNKAGLSSPNRPIASFLFTGPTGTGKTETVKELAANLGIKFNRLDMSEYMEKHSVSKLIGAAPGYVGYEEGGVLVEMIKKNPHSIILFDEIEKAHPSISNILLQILDNGSLTDNTGYKADFRNAIIVLTSNLGTKNSGRMGFGEERGSLTKKTESAIKGYFSLEIINRLDNIVEFNQLTKENILRIVDKNIEELQSQLDQNNVKIKFDTKSKEYIAEQGYDPTFGARPIAREFNKLVKREISNELLFGELTEGGEIKVSMKAGKLSFTFKKK